MKREIKPFLISCSIAMLILIICSFLNEEADIEVPVKTACIVTNLTLNPNQSMELCGKLVSMR